MMKKRATFSFLFLVVFGFGLLQATTEEHIKSMKEKMAVGPEGKKLAIGRLSLTTPDINLFMKGRIREEYYNLHKMTTLRGDYFDDLDMFRHKFSFYFYAIQGLQKFGKASTEAFMKLTNYNFWQNEGYYVHMTEEEITLDTERRVRVMDDHQHKLMVPAIFMEDVWVKLNFGTFIDALEKHPIDLKVGFFEYQLGRGISLGDYYDVGVKHLGWVGPGGATHFTQSPPGILVRGEITKDLHLDFYYTKWRETNNFPTDVREDLNWQLLKDTRSERGKTKDQDSWVARLDYDHESKRMGKFKVQPYFMWTRAPEQGIELKADAASKLGTVGMMVDWEHKGWNFNVEGAFQFGHQDVYAIDRNRVEVDIDENGDMYEYYSHVYQQNYYNATSKAPVKNELKAVVYNDDNRKVSQNGQQVVDVEEFYNSNIIGQERFRDAFKIDYCGFMAIADLSYDWKKLHLKPAITAGYISGDDYPYNPPYKNRNYKGFVTLRDQNYFGRAVESYAIMEGRITPRPLNMALWKGYAFNHDSDLSNMKFLGAGLTWHPGKKKEDLFFTINLISFWDNALVYKWDKEADVDLNKYSENEQQIRASNLVVRTARDQIFNFKGWESSHRASSHLGTEFNIKLQMHFQDSCEWRLRALIYWPGNLYKDLDGQPNRNTRRIDPDGTKHYEGLGHDTLWGVHTSLTYRF